MLTRTPLTSGTAYALTRMKDKNDRIDWSKMLPAASAIAEPAGAASIELQGAQFAPPPTSLLKEIVRVSPLLKRYVSEADVQL